MIKKIIKSLFILIQSNKVFIKIKSFNLLIEFGHSIIVVEHNIDLIKSADHIIDLGPYGGEKGGDIVYAGTVENLVKTKKSLLSSHLKSKLR